MMDRVVHNAMVRASTGWLIGRLHRPFEMSMVLAFLFSFIALDLPWLGRRAVDALENRALVAPFMFQLIAMFVTAVSVLLGGIWSNSRSLEMGAPARPGRRPA